MQGAEFELIGNWVKIDVELFQGREDYFLSICLLVEMVKSNFSVIMSEVLSYWSARVSFFSENS